MLFLQFHIICTRHTNTYTYLRRHHRNNKNKVSLIRFSWNFFTKLMFVHLETKREKKTFQKKWNGIKMRNYTTRPYVLRENPIQSKRNFALFFSRPFPSHLPNATQNHQMHPTKSKWTRANVKPKKTTKYQNLPRNFNSCSGLICSICSFFSIFYCCCLTCLSLNLSCFLNTFFSC